MEMLAELGMDASYDTAMRLKQLVRMFRSFEKAMEILGGPPGANPVELRRVA
jgi:hypothetical protein